MLELNQFQQSAFCLKVRMVLAAKKIPYRVIEITPGVGQVAIFRLSGQRQVPVLVDGNNVISNSSEIIRYLENLYPEPKLLPDNPKESAMVHLIEDWADTTLASSARTLLIKAALKDPQIVNALLPEEFPKSVRNLINHLPKKIIQNFSDFVSESKGVELLNSLMQISKLIESNGWLVGQRMSFADISVAAQLSLLKFPASAGSELEGKGCPSFSDHPELKTLFHWRDDLENTLMKFDPLEVPISSEND